MIATPTPVTTASQSTDNHGSLASGSVTLPAGLLLVAIQLFRSDGAATSVSSVANTSGLVWNRVGTGVLHGGAQLRGELWWAYNPTQQTSQTVTATFGDSTTDSSALTIDCIASGTATTAVVLASAIGSTSASPVSATLGTFQNTADATYEAVFSTLAGTITVGSGYSQVSTVTSSDSGAHMKTGFTSGQDTSVDATASGGGANLLAIIGVEIRDATAFSIGNIVSASDATNATSYTTGSFDVIAGRLYLIAFSNWDNISTANTPTATSSGGEAVTIIDTDVTGGVIRAGAYRFRASSTGTRTLTFDCSGGGHTQLRGGWCIDDVIGEDTGSPVVKSETGVGTTTNPTADLGSAPISAVNLTWGGIGANTSTLSPSSGWSQLGETTLIESALTVGTEVKPNSQTASWVTDSANSVRFAVEIKAAVAPPPMPRRVDRIRSLLVR